MLHYHDAYIHTQAKGGQGEPGGARGGQGGPGGPGGARGARGGPGGPGGKLNGALIKETGKMCCELQEKKYEDNVLHRLNSRAPLDNYIAWDTCITCIIFNAG